MLIITGSTGFVGSHLTQFLKKSRIKYRAISRVQITSETIKLSKGDTIIHIAGRIKGIFRSQFTRDNVELTNTLLTQAKKAAVAKFIFVSSARVSNNYPDSYTQSKKTAESLVKRSYIPYVIVRPSLLYGPSDSKNIQSLITMVRLSPLLITPSPRIKRQPLYIEDLVRVLIRAKKKKYHHRTITMVGSEIWSISDMVHEIARQLKINKSSITIPIPKLKNELFKGTDWQKEFHLHPTTFKVGIKKTLMR